MSFNEYIKKIKGDYRRAIKVEWLNPDESVNFEFTNALYDINVSLNVNYQNGCRRTCTLTLNNDRNKFPINFNNIWIGQKFKLWMGIYLDEKTPYYLPQGVFYISNPREVYNPNTRTVTINGVDKWAYLDGTLFGTLTSTYQTNVGTNLYDALKELISLPVIPTETIDITNKNINEYFEIIDSSPYYFAYNSTSKYFRSNNYHGATGTAAKTVLRLKQKCRVSFNYSYQTGNYGFFYLYDSNNMICSKARSTSQKNMYYSKTLNSGDEITFFYVKNSGSSTGLDGAYFKNIKITPFEQEIDPIPPFLTSSYLTKTDSNGNKVLSCPYTATVERGKTYADIILEYATILCANVYYDVNGRLVFEPMIDTADDITDTNKEILWHYTVDEKTFLGLTQTYNFDKVHNDFIILGNIVNGYQFKARVQNRNPMSNTCIQRIGLKTKEPIEDNQYTSDEQCKELAMYYAKTDTILQKSGDISSVVLYHLDVNKLVTVSTPNNNMSKELFLITGFSLSSGGTMNLNVTSVNILKDFSVVDVEGTASLSGNDESILLEDSVIEETAENTIEDNLTIEGDISE